MNKVSNIGNIDDKAKSTFPIYKCGYLLAVWGYDSSGNKEESIFCCSHLNNVDHSGVGICAEEYCPIGNMF